jgi:hypothetical protein
MSSPFRDVEIIKEAIKILGRAILELTQLLTHLKVEDKDEAYKVSIKGKEAKK